MKFDWSKPFSFDIAKQYSPTSSGGAPMFDPASMAIEAFDTESARRQLNTRNSTAFKDAARFTADLENRAQMIRNMGAGINMFGQTGQTARFTA
jgi:hypothetical protein